MFMKKPSQTTTILIALVLGAVFGLVLPSYGQSISFLGDIFLKLVQMSFPLLILGQVVAAVSHLNLRDLGKMGGSTLAIFIFRSCFLKYGPSANGIRSRNHCHLCNGLLANWYDPDYG